MQQTQRALEKERQRVTFLEEELAASERFAKKLAIEVDEWKVRKPDLWCWRTYNAFEP
jgi:hypothetical protein